MERIVKNKVMDYKLFQSYIARLNEGFDSLTIATCGRSVLGREIYALVMGEGQRNVVFVGGTHGQEWLTSIILMRLCEDILSGVGLCGYSPEELLRNVRLVVIPELNPDGIEIALQGQNNSQPLWNANARGVDINHNFNAGWYALRDYEEEMGISGPSPRRYGGPYPESEPETRAITRFLRSVDVDMLISFHSQGEEIYYEYGRNTPEKSLLIAKVLASLTEYTLVKNEGHCEGGGLKDWFIEEMRKPAFTIEIGKGQNPLPLTDVDEIYDRIAPAMVVSLLL